MEYQKEDINILLNHIVFIWSSQMKHICILYYFSELTWYSYLKFCLLEKKAPFIPVIDDKIMFLS